MTFSSNVPSRLTPPDWWEVAPACGFTALCLSQLARMETSKESRQVSGHAVHAGDRPVRSEVHPIAGWVS